MKPYIEYVKGNTYCIVLGYIRIPLYMLGDGKAILLDSGLHHSWADILELLERENLHITSVLTTHAHPDHIGNHLNLRHHFGSKLYMSPFCAAIYASPVNMTGLNVGLFSYRNICKKLGEPVSPDGIIDIHADNITVDGVSFGIISTCGHAAENLGFITPDNVAYLGDILLDAHMVKSLRAPYCTCIEPDLEAKASLAALKCDRYVLAHNIVVDDITELIQINCEGLLRIAADLEAICSEYITLDEITRQFLANTGGNPDTVRSVSGTQRNIRVFLEYLLDTDRLVARANNGIVEFKAKTPVV